MDDKEWQDWIYDAKLYNRAERHYRRGYWDKESFRHFYRRFRMLRHYRWEPPHGCCSEVISEWWPRDYTHGSYPVFKWPVVRGRVLEKCLRRRNEPIHMSNIPVFDERGGSQENWFYDLRIVVKLLKGTDSRRPKVNDPRRTRCIQCGLIQTKWSKVRTREAHIIWAAPLSYSIRNNIWKNIVPSNSMRERVKTVKPSLVMFCGPFCEYYWVREYARTQQFLREMETRQKALEAKFKYKG